MSERRADPFGVLALAGAGTMVAHELGYVTDHGRSAGAHRYFDVLGPILLIALCVAGWIAAVRIIRRDNGRAPSVALLAGLQVVLYVLMETGEHIVSGATDAAISPPVVLGLALQPVVAWAALRLLATGGRIVRCLFVEPVRAAPIRPVVVPTPLALLSDLMVPLRLRVRGPPVG